MWTDGLTDEIFSVLALKIKARNRGGFTRNVPAVKHREQVY